MWKKILGFVVPIAIKTAETAFSQQGQGKTRFGVVTSIAQSILLATAGAEPDGVTHQQAANTNAIRKTVQEIFDEMATKGQVTKLK